MAPADPGHLRPRRRGPGYPAGAPARPHLRPGRALRGRNALVTEPQIEVLDDPSVAVGELMVQAAADGKHVVLTGGSTPRAAYEHAAGLGADWSRATLWFGDERCVPPDHEQSNFAMADKALLSKIEAGAGPPLKGELGPAAGGG